MNLLSLILIVFGLYLFYHDVRKDYQLLLSHGWLVALPPLVLDLAVALVGVSLWVESSVLTGVSLTVGILSALWMLSYVWRHGGRTERGSDRAPKLIRFQMRILSHHRRMPMGFGPVRALASHLEMPLAELREYEYQPGKHRLKVWAVGDSYFTVNRADPTKLLGWGEWTPAKDQFWAKRANTTIWECKA